MGGEEWGHWGGNDQALGHRAEACSLSIRTEAWSLRPRTQGEEARERPQLGRAQGPGQKQASSRLAHRQVGRKTSREAPEQGRLSPGPLLQTTEQQQQNKVGTNI